MNLSSYAELAVRLVNTAVPAPGEPDPLSSPQACSDALADCLAGPVTRRDLGVLCYLRDEFTAIFTAAATGTDQAAVKRLNALLVQFPIQPEVVSHDDLRWHVHLAPHGSVADRFAAGAAVGVALTISLVGVSRLGICAIAACPRVFIDASPGRSRRYCAEHAAARGNVSTLRAQQSVSGDPAADADTRPGHATPAAS